ncbi:heavy metal translocating P-type ATPase [Planctomycetota bacterium]
MPKVKRANLLNENVSKLAFSVGGACGLVARKANQSVARAKAAADKISNRKEYLVAERVQKLSEILGTKKRDNSLDTASSSGKILVFGAVISETALLLTTTGFILADLIILGVAGSLFLMVGGAAAALVLAIPIFKKSALNIKERKWNLNILIATSIILAVAIGEIIFALFVAWAIRLGIAMQDMNKKKMRRAITDMMNNGDKKLWLVTDDGVEVEVDIEQIKRRDKIAVHTGEKICVDGKIVEGDAAVSQAMLSGESVPVYKGKKDKVYAGTIVVEGKIIVSVTKVGMDTEIGNIIRSIEEARDLRAPLANVSDKFARVFVPSAFAVAIGALIVTGSVPIAITVLIMASPCAVLLATPSAVFAGIRNGVKNEILIKGGFYLEGVGQTGTVIFDKTGTITKGKPEIIDIVSVASKYSEEKVLSLAASGEYHSKHPFARAILQRARAKKLKIARQSKFNILPGKGVVSTLKDKSRIAVGGKNILSELKISRPYAITTIVNRMKKTGQSVVYVAMNSSIIGLIGLIDSPRPEAARVLDRLRKLGVSEMIMLTGDHQQAAEAIANDLGLAPVHSDLSPQEKLDIVKKYKQQKKQKVVAMVGEGLNDAPALAYCDVGIALGTDASDHAINEAGIVIAGSDLNKVPDAICLGRRTSKVVKQNYVVGVGVNILGVTLAAMGMIAPLSGVLLHEAATATVLLNSCRLLSDGKQKTKNIKRA